MPISVGDIGSFFVGGHIRRLEGLPPRVRVSTPNGPVHPVDQNGEIMVGQMYVQYVHLSPPQIQVPLLMWHGGGMTGVNWETTPDGRPGWQMFFLRAGFNTYISDAVERGRAGWAPFPEVYGGTPFFRTAKEAWEETFRFGPVGSWHVDPILRRTHGGLRFPVARIEDFLCQSVPRWSGNNALTQAAYDALVARMTEGAIVLTHSQGGNFGLSATLAAPERIRAVISIEPSGAPDVAKTEAEALRNVPHLFVWGDYLDRHDFWLRSRPAVERWRDTLLAIGADVTWIDLPEHGIKGNSHALMSDNNSDEIAAMVLRWLRDRGIC